MISLRTYESSPSILETKNGRLFCFGSTVHTLTLTLISTSLQWILRTFVQGFFTYHKRSTPSTIQTTAIKLLEITFVPFKVLMQFKQKQVVFVSRVPPLRPDAQFVVRNALNFWSDLWPFLVQLAVELHFRPFLAHVAATKCSGIVKDGRG